MCFFNKQKRPATPADKGFIKTYRGDRRDYTSEFRGEPNDMSHELRQQLKNEEIANAEVARQQVAANPQNPQISNADVQMMKQPTGEDPNYNPLPGMAKMKAEWDYGENGPPQQSQSNGVLTNFIIDQETGGEEYYNKALSRPSWPKAQSGVTIGAGYDLGYNSPEEIRRDWAGKLPPEQIDRLVKFSGIKGQAAQAAARQLKDIQVPYSVAKTVFHERTLPRFEEMTRKTIGSKYDTLAPEQKTALVSLGFNRGWGLEGDRRSEMRDIVKAVNEDRFDAVPDLYRKQKRLWENKGVDGLLKRRDAEANLWASAKKPSTDIVNIASQSSMPSIGGEV